MIKLEGIWLGAVLLTGCITGEGNVYAVYDQAMAHCDGYQMSYEWQRENRSAIEQATKKEVLAAFVATDVAADALLSKIGAAYDGDPLVATQIASVTQLVMTPGCPKAPECRQIWVAALKRARAKAADEYGRTFCDEQLRLCIK